MLKTQTIRIGCIWRFTIHSSQPFYCRAFLYFSYTSHLWHSTSSSSTGDWLTAFLCFGTQITFLSSKVAFVEWDPIGWCELLEGGDQIHRCSLGCSRNSKRLNQDKLRFNPRSSRFRFTTVTRFVDWNTCQKTAQPFWSTTMEPFPSTCIISWHEFT